MTPDLNEYFFFAAVVSHGGFSAAARQLKVPKSRLSKQVTALESRLGVRLLERSTRRFAVTDLGREFYRHCEAIMAGAEEAEGLIARARAEPHGVLRVSCPPGLVPHAMADIVPSFMAAHPNVRVELQVMNRRADLIEDRIDVALRVRAEPEEDSSVVVKVLGRTHVGLVASPDFLGRHDVTGGPETLSRLPTLCFDAGDYSRWSLTGPGDKRVNVAVAPVLVASDFAVLTEAAAQGLGILLLPLHACAGYIRSGRLVTVLPEWRGPDGTMQIAFTSRRGMLPAQRAFIDHVSAELPPRIAQCDRAARRGSPVQSGQ
jgi:DNA-binding transcriptional LysR family regulator